MKSKTNEFFCYKRAIFADFSKISKVNDRREKRYDFPINVSLTCFSINYYITAKNFESSLHFLAS